MRRHVCVVSPSVSGTSALPHCSTLFQLFAPRSTYRRSETSETSETNAAQTTKRPKVQEIFKAVEERFTASEPLPPSSAGASSSQLPPPPPPSLQIKKSKAERNAGEGYNPIDLHPHRPASPPLRLSNSLRSSVTPRLTRYIILTCRFVPQFAAALDARIQLLDEKTAGKKGKKKKIADKVKQMLIKSRAEGEKRLRAEDR